MGHTSEEEGGAEVNAEHNRQVHRFWKRLEGKRLVRVELDPEGEFYNGATVTLYFEDEMEVEFTDSHAYFTDKEGTI